MASIEQYQRQFQTALKNAPSFLVLQGYYIYKTAVAGYDPSTDSYTGTKTNNVDLSCIRGSEIVEGVNQITFLTETRVFTEGKPSVNGTLVIAEESWNIKSVRQDAIGLTYTFVVENKDGI